MKTITAALLGAAALIAGPEFVHGQQDNEGDIAPQQREELRRELSEVRETLAESARRMAEIQRRLASEDEAFGFAWQFDAEEGNGKPVDIEQLRMFANGALEDLKLWPPRIGVLLAGAGDDENDPRTVVGLTPGGGADEAGIRRGDVLVAVDGKPVERDAVDRIQSILSRRQPGDIVEVEVLRNGQTRRFSVKTSSMGEDIRIIVKRFEDFETLGEGLDFDVDSMTLPIGPIRSLLPRLSALGSDADLVANHDGLQGYFGTGDGVLVVRIDDGNALGLRAGDVILSVDREPVEDPIDLGRRLMARESGSEIAIEVMRDGVLTELSGVLPERSDGETGMHRFRLLRPGPPALPAPSAARQPARPDTASDRHI